MVQNVKKLLGVDFQLISSPLESLEWSSVLFLSLKVDFRVSLSTKFSPQGHWTPRCKPRRMDLWTL